MLKIKKSRFKLSSMIIYCYLCNHKHVIMEINFENKEIKDFILSGTAESRPYSKWRSNRQLRLDLDKVMRILSTVDNCAELQLYKALHYEQLKYKRIGQSSVRLGFKSKFRLIFTEFNNGIVINIIEISEHYGDK